MVKNLTSKTHNSIASQAQKLQSNCRMIEKKFNYLLQPAELPELHDKLVKEFARRYYFEHLLKQKEKDLSRFISNENSKRHRFLTQNSTVLHPNPITLLLNNDRIDLKIDRIKDIPAITDVEAEEILYLREESEKEMKEKKKMEAFKDELRILKAQLKLK